MAFEKGKPKTGGRRPGRVNHFTGAFREAVQIVYSDLGGHEAFARWGKKNPTEFYRIASRLIPLEIKGGGNQAITVVVQRLTAPPILDVLPAVDAPARPED